MTRRCWALGALFVILPLPASAQEADAEAGEPPQFTEEVTVTARKREENLQSVPFSMVAPTQQALRNRGAASLEDVAANVAGFSVQNLGPGQSQIAMRGVSAGPDRARSAGRQGTGRRLSRRVGHLTLAVHAGP